MNIDDCIEVQQGFKAGKNVELRRLHLSIPTGWHAKDENTPFNFIDFEYRIAPDVVYKIERDDRKTTYENYRPDGVSAVNATISKGYWVEGNPA